MHRSPPLPLLHRPRASLSSAPTAARRWSLLGLLVAAGCGGADRLAGGEAAGPEVAAIALTAASVTLSAVGSSEVVTARVVDAQGRPLPQPQVAWSSSDLTVADVTGSGASAVITARAPGRAVITARAGGRSAAIEVRVVTIRAITVSPATLNLRAADHRDLVATVDAGAGEVVALRWTSSNPDVATVTADGRVTGVTTGATSIRVEAEADPRIGATVAVNVLPPRTVRLSLDSLTLWVGDRRRLAADVDVDATESAAVAWSSSAPEVATVSANGEISAVGVGIATVRAVAEADARARDSVRVRVLPERRVVVSPTQLSLGPGEQRTLAAQVTIEPGISTAVVWRSANPAVATVSPGGVVTGVAFGSTTVTAVAAADSTRSATALVSVVPTVRDVRVEPAVVTLFTGDTARLVATLTADPGAGTGVIWRSSAPHVATVSATGLVQAQAAGAATITALAAADTMRRATSLVTVRAAPIVTVTPPTATLSLDAEVTLTATVQADPGVSTAVLWRSSAPAVASVSAGGVVTARSFGTATISALAVADTNRRASATVQVVPIVRAIELSPPALAVAPGETRALTATVMGDPGAPSGVLWRSSAPQVAAVSADGRVTGASLGTATITAIAAGDTTKRATASVTVRPAPVVTVTPTAATLAVGEQRTVTATVTTDQGVTTAVSWRSTDPTVATVGANGVVTAVGVGTAQVIAVAAADTTRSAAATITVVPTVRSVALSPSTAALNVGGAVQLVPTVVADAPLSTAVTWRSSNGAIASVGPTGLVTGVAAGTATVTAVAVADTTRRATATITVTSRLATAWTPTRVGGALFEDVVSIVALGASSAYAVNLLGDVFAWNGGTWTLAARGTTYGTQFLWVHASGGSNVIAVGTNGVIVRFDGTAWTPMASGTTRTLQGVWVESATSAFAVGANGTALRFNGAAWTPTTTGTTAQLNGVWATGGIAFATASTGEMLRFSGGTWTRQATPSAEPLYGVAGTSATSVVAVGPGSTIVRFNGTAWTRVSATVAADLYGVAGSSANGGRMYIASDAGLLQLDGSVLATVNTPLSPAQYAVAMDPTGAVWAGGQRGVVQRLASGAWSTLNLAPDLLDVWTTAPNNAWAVGEFGAIYRWTGTVWARQPAPTTATLLTVWAPDATVAFAGGNDGTMLRFNGTTWSALSVPTTADVNALWGTSATNVYAATSAGTVLRFNGTSWSTVASAGVPLFAIHGASAGNIRAVGEHGVTLHFDGATWTTGSAGAVGALSGVWVGVTGSDVAVGTSADWSTGVALRRAGASWSQLATGTSRILTSVWGPAADDLYATGEQGTLLRWNGTAWSGMSTGTTELLWSVSGAPGGTGGAFAVGFNGVILSGSSGAGARVASGDATAASRAVAIAVAGRDGGSARDHETTRARGAGTSARALPRRAPGAVRRAASASRGGA
jgi:uncharacterized protein YjdB